jgi:hypothetical protein
MVETDKTNARHPQNQALKTLRLFEVFIILGFLVCVQKFTG